MPKAKKDSKKLEIKKTSAQKSSLSSALPERVAFGTLKGHYNHQAIEKKSQNFWAAKKNFETTEDPAKEKKYVLAYMQ